MTINILRFSSLTGQKEFLGELLAPLARRLSSPKKFFSNYLLGEQDNSGLMQILLGAQKLDGFE